VTMSNSKYYDPIHAKQHELLLELQSLIDQNYDPEYIKNVYADMSRSLWCDDCDDYLLYDKIIFTIDDMLGHRVTNLEPGICLADVYVHIPCKDPHHTGVHTSLISHLGGVGCISCYERTVITNGLIYPTE
jgi:hypothetical protein